MIIRDVTLMHLGHHNKDNRERQAHNFGNFLNRHMAGSLKIHAFTALKI